MHEKSDKGSLFPAHGSYLCPKIFAFLCFLADYEGFFSNLKSFPSQRKR